MKWEYGQKKAAASVFIAWMMSKSASIADEKNNIERGFFWWNGNPKICQFGKQPVCVFCVPFHLGKPLGSKHLWSRKVGSNPSMRPQVAAVDLASSHWVEQFTVMGCEAVGMPPNLSWMGFQIQSWTFRKIESWEGLDFLKKHKWRPLEIFSLPGVYEVWRPRHAPIIFLNVSRYWGHSTVCSGQVLGWSWWGGSGHRCHVTLVEFLGVARGEAAAQGGCATATPWMSRSRRWENNSQPHSE